MRTDDDPEDHGVESDVRQRQRVVEGERGGPLHHRRHLARVPAGDQTDVELDGDDRPRGDEPDHPRHEVREHHAARAEPGQSATTANTTKAPSWMPTHSAS